MSDPIKRITLKDGSVRYRFVVDIGTDANGKRQQKRLTFDRLAQARAELARIRHEAGTGTYVAPARTTLDEVLDAYLVQATRDVEAGTAAKYRAVLKPVRDHLGARPVQALREEDIDELVDWMLASARRRGGKPGSGLSAATVSLARGQLRSALNLAVRRGLVIRNVALDTKIPREARSAAAAKQAERKPWTEDETRTFLRAIASDRLYAPILMLCMGLRPAEVCGMPWSDVDLTSQPPGSVRVATTRTIVEGQVVEKGTKTAAGTRVLPLPAVASDALREFSARQASECLAAGPAYNRGGHVLVDELGRPFKTDQLRRWLYKLMAEAGVRKVRPYDARHACLTYLATSGIPDVVVSAWAGHTDVSFTKRRYVHPDGSHLVGAAEQLDVLLRQVPGA